MTAGEAAARPEVRLRVALAARCQDRAVVRVLKGWTGGQAGKRYAVLAALEAEGVDLDTIPELTASEQERMRQKARPCPACAAKDAELADLDRRRAKLRAFTAGLVKQCRETDYEVDDWVERAHQLELRVAELEAGKQAGLAVVAEHRYPVTPSDDPACEHINEGPSRPVLAERIERVPPEPRDPSLIGKIERRRGVQCSKPCIAGTRITVETFQSLARSGYTDERILDLYPYLDIADVLAALAYQEPPHPAPRPREKCKVSLVHEGEDLLAKAVAP